MNTRPGARENNVKSAARALGIALIAVGLTLLLSEADIALSRISLGLGFGFEQWGSFFPGLLLTVDRAIQAWVFDRPSLLSSFREMLISCWPVVLVMLGALLLQADRRRPTSTASLEKSSRGLGEV
jgi:hypothetical protein